MKPLVKTFLLFVLPAFAIAQNKEMDSLKHLLAISPNDTSRILKMAEICHHYGYTDYDSSISYGQKALELSERNNYPRGKSRAYFGLGCAYVVHGDISKSLELQLNGLQLAEENHFDLEKAACLIGIGFCYRTLKDTRKAISYFQKASEINKKVKQEVGLDFVNVDTELNLGLAYLQNDQPDSSLIYLKKILAETEILNFHSAILNSISYVYQRLGQYQSALNFAHEALALDIKNDDPYSTNWAYSSLALTFKALKQVDSCIYYAQKMLDIAQKHNYKVGIFQSSLLLSEQYENTNPKEALKYRKIYDSVNEELYGANKVVALQKTMLDEQERQRDIEAKRIAKENRLKMYGALSGLSIMFLIGFILYRNNRQKQKANELLQKQKEEIENQKATVESTLKELRSTQNQLIQSEKLASLGELTAGIAHEIQNPMNFVNNFSKFSVGIAKELNEEMNKPIIDKEYVAELLKDLSSNQEKITFHGERASSIVSGMLEHSRTNAGVKGLTDINKLCDEYLRLSFHALRNKDKNFNAEMITHFDESIPEIEIVGQDVGRVILNIINNAFYAVNERKNLIGSAHYKPTVTIITQKTENTIEIRIKDNGIGMPETVKEKIFQPFFTTKPTGSGTGLGLSLAYDIITKGHRGALNVESEEEVGSEFIIILPLK